MIDHILDKAFILFADKGTQFNMNELAKMLNLKAPSIYNYFKSKDDIIIELIHREIETFYRYFGSVFDSFSDESPEVKLKTIFYSLINYHSDMNKAKFWRRFGLLDGSQKKEVITLLFENDNIVYKKVTSILQEQISQYNSLDHLHEGVTYLFFTTIQGIISIRVYHDSSSAYYIQLVDKTWVALWSGVLSILSSN